MKARALDSVQFCKTKIQSTTANLMSVHPFERGKKKPENVTIVTTMETIHITTTFRVQVTNFRLQISHNNAHNQTFEWPMIFSPKIQIQTQQNVILRCGELIT